MDLLAFILAISAEGITDEQVQTALNAYIAEHPEAVTTVTDGSITKAKLDSNLKETVDDVGVLKSAVAELEEGSLSALGATAGQVPVADGNGSWAWGDTGFVTPEMFGAIGDGETDDTAELQAAIDSGKPVLGVHDYYITDTIEINGGVETVLTGVIVYGGERTKPAVTITGRNNTVRINTIVDKLSYGVNQYDGGWHGWGDINYIGLNIENAHSSAIWVNRIINFTTGLKMAATGTGNFQNTISGKNILNCKYFILVETVGEHGWMNSSKINGFEINNSSRTSDIGIAAESITQYGIYQKISNNNTYGCRYMQFDQIVFEMPSKDSFQGFYFELISNSIISNVVSEIANNAKFAEFNIITTTDSTLSSILQASYNNIFEKVGFMGGNTDIIFSGNASAAICSLNQIVRIDTDRWNSAYKDDSMYGKALITNATGTNGTQGIIKGYTFTRRNYTGGLDSAKLGTTEDGSARNDATSRTVLIPAVTPISLKIPVVKGDTYRIITQGTKSYVPSVMLKAFASDGAMIVPTTSREKPIAGNFYADASTYMAFLPFSSTNIYEFTVVDSNAAYIVVLISGRLTGFEIYALNNISPEIQRHWGNLEYLNFADSDKFYINKTPSSVANNDTAFVGQRIYDARSQAQMGGYWELTANGWTHSS